MQYNHDFFYMLCSHALVVSNSWAERKINEMCNFSFPFCFIFTSLLVHAFITEVLCMRGKSSVRNASRMQSPLKFKFELHKYF
jgi:hypothetical protein